MLEFLADLSDMQALLLGASAAVLIAFALDSYITWSIRKKERSNG